MATQAVGRTAEVCLRKIKDVTSAWNDWTCMCVNVIAEGVFFRTYLMNLMWIASCSLRVLFFILGFITDVIMFDLNSNVSIVSVVRYFYESNKMKVDIRTLFWTYCYPDDNTLKMATTISTVIHLETQESKCQWLILGQCFALVCAL